MTKRPVGRPSKNREVRPCKKQGCHEPAKEGQVYCCRDHAPYGWLDLEKGKNDKPKARPNASGDEW